MINNRANQGRVLAIRDLSKSYGDLHVLENLNLNLVWGKVYCLMAPSGAGKTTLFRILMGLETADSGHIEGIDKLRVSSVFQEDRLLDGYTAIQNLRFVTGRRFSPGELEAAALRLLPADALNKPVWTFSGGMKRRTAILRAILAPSDLLIMDEPFTGLDLENRQSAAQMIREYTKEKLLLVSTHTPEDIKLLHGELIHL